MGEYIFGSFLKKFHFCYYMYMYIENGSTLLINLVINVSLGPHIMACILKKY